MMLYRATEARDLRLRFSTILNHHVVAMQALVRRWQMARIYIEMKRCAPIYQVGKGLSLPPSPPLPPSLPPLLLVVVERQRFLVVLCMVTSVRLRHPLSYR